MVTAAVHIPPSRKKPKPQLVKTSSDSAPPNRGDVGTAVTTEVGNGEATSPLLPDPALLTYEQLAAMSEAARAEYMQKVLAESEERAFAVLAPLRQKSTSFAEAFAVYKPMILVMKPRLCARGRRRAGKKTWEEWVKETFGVSIRWMQMQLAAPKSEEQSGQHPQTKSTSPRSGRNEEERKEEERFEEERRLKSAVEVCRPLAEAVNKLPFDTRIGADHPIREMAKRILKISNATPEEDMCRTTSN